MILVFTMRNLTGSKYPMSSRALSSLFNSVRYTQVMNFDKTAGEITGRQNEKGTEIEAVAFGGSLIQNN